MVRKRSKVRYAAFLLLVFGVCVLGTAREVLIFGSVVSYVRACCAA